MICEKCGKEHDGTYGSGRFCSSLCAHSFSSSNRSLQSRQKTAEAVSKQHIHICPKCHKLFYNRGTAPNVLCDSCKPIKFCKYCGAKYGECKRPDICKKYKLFPKMI